MKMGAPAIHFAISSEGGHLYAVSPKEQSLAIYDTATFDQLGLLSNLGGTPAKVLIPPPRE